MSTVWLMFLPDLKALIFYFDESLIGKRSPVLICLNYLKKVAFEMSYINICQVELHVHVWYAGLIQLLFTLCQDVHLKCFSHPPSALYSQIRIILVLKCLHVLFMCVC